ncbi:MAG: hypothetical protein ABH919_04140, partial [bacterium]
FIDHHTVDWIGNAKEGFPSAIVQSNPFPAAVHGTPYPPTITEYNSEYLRWAGEVKAGQSATWGEITIEQSSEIPVGNATGPRPPAIIYGNIREATGVGINLLIFDEENYQAWKSGEKDVQFRYLGKNLSDYNYTLDISHNSYYIVADNPNASDDAFVGFTGVLAYIRPLELEETPFTQNQYFACVWDIKNEKLTLWEYVLKLFQPSYGVSVTPPIMSEDY